MWTRGESKLELVCNQIACGLRLCRAKKASRVTKQTGQQHGPRLFSDRPCPLGPPLPREQKNDLGYKHTLDSLSDADTIG
jgi:hypothetical protein